MLLFTRNTTENQPPTITAIKQAENDKLHAKIEGSCEKCFLPPNRFLQWGIYSIVWFYIVLLLLRTMSTKHLTPSLNNEHQPHVLVGICVIVY